MENAKARAGDNLQDPKITKGMVDGFGTLEEKLTLLGYNCSHFTYKRRSTVCTL